MNTKLCAMVVMIIVAAFIDSIACEKIPTDSEVISMIDKLDEEQSLPLFGGLALEKVDGASDVLPRSSESLTDRIVRYLKSHSVNFDLSEARGKLGGKIKFKPNKIIKKVKSTFQIQNISFINIHIFTFTKTSHYLKSNLIYHIWRKRHINEVELVGF